MVTHNGIHDVGLGCIPLFGMHEMVGFARGSSVRWLAEMFSRLRRREIETFPSGLGRRLKFSHTGPPLRTDRPGHRVSHVRFVTFSSWFSGLERRGRYVWWGLELQAVKFIGHWCGIMCMSPQVLSTVFPSSISTGTDDCIERNGATGY